MRETDSIMTEDEAVKRQRWLARGMTIFVFLSVDDDFDAWREAHGASFESMVREAIAAMLVICENERSGPFSSHERRARILERVNRIKDLFEAGGITDDVRQIARSVVEEVDPNASRWFEEHPDQAKYGRDG